MHPIRNLKPRDLQQCFQGRFGREGEERFEQTQTNTKMWRRAVFEREIRARGQASSPTHLSALPPPLPRGAAPQSARAGARGVKKGK